MNNQYNFLAKVYDELMYDIDYTQWADYLLTFLKERKNIIEYACGTGNITTQLVRKGCEVIAVDSSEQMLDIAMQKTKKAAQDIRYVCEDMCELKLHKKMQAAVCACDGVNYILTETNLERFFENVFCNLEERAVFLFDISSAYKLKEILGDEFFYDDGDEQTYFWQNSFDEKTKILSMNITLFIAQNTVYQRFDECHTQRAWSIEEIFQALEKAGFKEIKAYEFETKNKIKDDTQRIQIAAVKGEYR
ncbi:MAG: class I SAM-dependent methyltransferase [Christensenellaceae bacterium]